MVFHNPEIEKMARPGYMPENIRAIISLLEQNRTLELLPLPNGLFQAAALDESKHYTGYSHVWVRDNIHIANALYTTGNVAAATKNAATLMEYFSKHKQRFLRIIETPAKAAIPMNRPHIRFNGRTLEEIPEKWAHAQNDALGYFLWFFCKLVNEKVLRVDESQLHMLGLFAHYFEAIQFWQDEDSGHWEETRKISASSIGVVVAGVLEFHKLLRQSGTIRDNSGLLVTLEYVDRLIERGRTALAEILPSECIQSGPIKQRRYDAALLFLIYPLQVIPDEMADHILEDVVANLQGKIGIRRYPKDSYWAPDYKARVAPAQRTADCSDDISSRSRLISKEGEEAQWCIFDPILSRIFGMKFKSTGSQQSFAEQCEYLSRSLAQITGNDEDVPTFRCPELYYLEAGDWVANDHVPLLWTQANLMLALQTMQESVASIHLRA